MAKNGFDLAALARESMGKAVSDSDTIELIPAERIRANEANFYEMSDLEELAASIELTGLLHPVIVKLDPEGAAGYVLIDGERRFRAMTEVLGRTEIPCRRVTPVNEVIEELMLIEANRTQRKMTSAELSRQAERYTELLAKLRESGVPIPGRLRAAVAEAMQVSETKLARLSAIRKNLIPELLEDFDAGKLNESVAYTFSVYLPSDQQRVYMSELYTPENLTADGVHQLVKKLCCTPSYKAKPAPMSDSDIGKRWDPVEYMEQRRAEDQDFYLMLGLEADRFIPYIADAKSRQDGIQALKEHFGRDHSGWYIDDVCVNCSMKGLELGSEERAIPFIERTWTDVYDMLCRGALYRDAKRSRVSDAGTVLVWHDTQVDGPPPEDARNIVCWGDAGLYKPLAHMLRQEFEVNSDNCRWWAVVEGPEMEAAE